MYSIEERQKLLCKELGIKEETIDTIERGISGIGRYFVLEDGIEYWVLDLGEREEAIQEEIKETCSYFIPSFLAEETGLPEEIFPPLSDKNEVVYKLIEKCVDGGFKRFCKDAIDVDGYGHFLSPYDSMEIELTDDLFAYRYN